jgi:cell division protein FtsN
MAGLDLQRLVLEYPGGAHSDEALLRLGLISAAAENLTRAAGYFRTLVTDYPRSPQRRRAQEWLSENFVAVEEAELANAESRELEVRERDSRELGVPEPGSREIEADDPESTEAASTRYAVQVGAFESEERARSLLASVNASGFQARLVHVTGSALAHVRIGAFLDRARAVDLMDRVRRRGHEATIAVDVAEEEPMR